MASALKTLLSSENAEEIIGFLRNRGERAHIIAPDWVQSRVHGRNSNAPAGPAKWTQDAAAVAAASPDRINFIVVAEDMAQEKNLLASLSARKGDKAYGLFKDVLPALLCGVNGMAPSRPVGELARYALLCIPRSGSRYLAAVLSNRGIGIPKEHIREPLANIITEGGMGFRNAVSSLERFGQRNRIFGTKIISTFLLKASHRRMREAEANIAWMVKRGYHFFRLERAAEESAVSSYIAFLMKKWHFFGEMDEGNKDRLDTLTFEPGAAWEEYIRLRAEKIVIDSLVRAHGIPTVRYSEIETDIDGVVQRVCDALRVDQRKLERGSARIPLSTRSESPTYANFAQRLREVIDKRQNELEARIVNKVRALTSLARPLAGKLVAESGISVPSSASAEIPAQH